MSLRRFRSALMLWLGVFTALNLCAQEPLKIPLCQLVQDPAKFNGLTIQVRGRVSLGFENFSLDTSDCGSRESVWLAYGGDEPTPTTSTVNDQERTPGSAPKVNGRRILLHRDESLELFKSRLVAQRVGQSDETICHERSCYLYNVTATITGVFLQKGGNSGYGHLGCCHLLFIQSVEAVDAERTAVPAGGQFRCSHDVWTMDATTIENLQRRKCISRLDCERAFGEQLSKIATHWGDIMDPRDGITFGYLMGSPRWVSHDLTKSYSLVVHHVGRKDGTDKVTDAEATRNICSVISPPYPQDVSISCKHLWSEFNVTKQELNDMRSSPKAVIGEWRLQIPEIASRTALQDAARLWGVTLVPNITLGECNKPTKFKGEQVTFCTWSDPNSMQSFTVVMTRFGSLRRSKAWETVPWILTAGYGLSCKADSQN